MGMNKNDELNTAIEHLKVLVEFAYANGFHELGYDPIGVLLQAQGEPQSSDQVWNEAIEAAIEIANGEKLSGSTNSPRDAAHEVAVDGVVRSLLYLKRPSQAQEPSPDEPKPCRECDPSVGVVCDNCASVSGAVDESALNAAGWEFIEYAPKGSIPPVLWNNLKQALRPAILKYLSRAQATQPAQQAPAVSDELPVYAYEETSPANSSHMVYAAWFHKYGRKFKKGYSYDALVRLEDVRALLSQPAAAPVSDQPIASRDVLNALNWTIAHLYVHGEIGRAELVRKATTLLPAPSTPKGGDKP
jgi:hypothetical protein